MEAELPRTTAPYVVVLARATLSKAVEIMLASAPAAGVMVLEDFDPLQLASLASRILADDLFGLDKGGKLIEGADSTEQTLRFVRTVCA